MTLLQADTPLYNHPLPDIEQWLKDLGCQKNQEQPHCWQVERPTWTAKLCLEAEEITVRYFNVGEGHQDISRSFKYSLTRQDIEAAIFAGP